MKRTNEPNVADEFDLREGGMGFGADALHVHESAAVEQGSAFVIVLAATSVATTVVIGGSCCARARVVSSAEHGNPKRRVRFETEREYGDGDEADTDCGDHFCPARRIRLVEQCPNVRLQQITAVRFCCFY